MHLFDCRPVIQRAVWECLTDCMQAILEGKPYQHIPFRTRSPEKLKMQPWVNV